MRGRRGSAEATHDQLVFHVVLCVPDLHILEQTAECAQDVVSLGAYLLSALVHGPCPDVLQPRLVLWEEVYAHVLQTQFCHRLRHIFVRRPALRCG